MFAQRKLSISNQPSDDDDEGISTPLNQPNAMLAMKTFKENNPPDFNSNPLMVIEEESISLRAS